MIGSSHQSAILEHREPTLAYTSIVIAKTRYRNRTSG